MRLAVALLVAGMVCGGCADLRRAAPSRPMALQSAVAPAEAKKLAAKDERAAVDALAGNRVALGQPKLTQSMIIRTGQVSIRVDSLEPAVRLVTDLAGRVGGFLANTAMQTGEGASRTATLEIRLPADRYSGALDQLRAIGKIISATSNAQDVGEEFVDVNARVTNAKRLEERLLNLLATRTGKLEDVLGVERELARVREEIERYEGRIRYLQAQVSMSTLSITVFEPVPIVGQPGSNVIVEAFKESWRNLVNATAAAIAMAGAAVPVLTLGLIGFLGIRRFRRRTSPAS
jgi:hypothetical protein